MSTAILQLSENGDLQKIHDKWLMRSACSMEGSELESDQLHLKSFWGLFLICGIACFLALLIYFFQILKKLRRAAPPDSISGGTNDSRSGRLRRFFSLIDEKSKHNSNSGSKRRKVERSLSENDKNKKWEKSNPQSSQTEMTTINSINSIN